MTFRALARSQGEMRRVLLIAMVGLMVSLGVTDSASACSCVGPGRVYEDAKVAFNARIVDKEREGNGQVFTYRILKLFKSQDRWGLKEGEEIRLPVFGYSACASPRRVGEREGVVPYRDREDDELQANGCTVTSPKRLRKIAIKNGDGEGGAGVASGCGAA